MPGSIDASAAGTLRLGDLAVNRMGFGAMWLCGADVWGRRRRGDIARSVLHRAIELGVNLIDTADSYGPDVDELLIAEHLHPYPRGLVIATKGGFLRPNRRSWKPAGRPEHLRRALDGSLRRLRLERIDLYQLHTPDPKVPFAESFGALADMQRAGKIRHLGVSNVSIAELEQARRIAPVVAVQNRFNLRDRSSTDVLAACERSRIAFLPWSPLGSSRGIRTDAIRRVAARHRVSSAQVSLAWLLARSPVMLPIPGTQSVEHLEENVRAAKLKLKREDLSELGE